MGQLLYILFVRLYPLGARLIAPFNEKAKRWVKGRKNIFRTIKQELAGESRERIWFHAASLGEFEQGKPLMEKLKEKYPSASIVLTFFSPSGYENAKNYSFADHIFYLPMDSFIHSYRFFRLVKPKLIFFIKYEFWYYYLSRAKKKGIPTFLLSAVFREDQIFFKWYGGFQRKILSCFTHIFVQNSGSEKLLHRIKYSRVSVSGDTRFDRVLELKSIPRAFPLIESIIQNKIVMVAGSTWTEDDKILSHFVISNPEMLFIIAPHDVGNDRLKESEEIFKNTIRFSMLGEAGKPDEKINTIIIDNIGILKHLYRYADITYVGGGFGADGVHNVLEPAVFGKPVIFGPVYEKFLEAADLIERQAAFSVSDAIDLENKLHILLTDVTLRKQTGINAANYVADMAGATGKVMDYIEANRLLTS